MQSISVARGQRLYSRIAPCYKFLHTFQTLGADFKHRRLAVETVNLKPSDHVLDIGTGTALTAIMASRQADKVVGIDLNHKMLIQGQKEICRAGAGGITLIQVDVQELPFPSNHFDVVLSVYGLGGVQNIKKAVQEAVRVAADGARFVFAEMSLPPKSMPIRRWLHQHLVAPFIKRAWEFRDLDLPSLLKEAGVQVEQVRHLSDRFLGSTTMVSGTIYKPDSSSPHKL